MTSDVIRRGPALVTGAAPFERASGHGVSARLRQAAGVGADVLLVLAVVLCIPVVILAVGTPLALLLRLLVWIGQLF